MKREAARAGRDGTVSADPKANGNANASADVDVGVDVDVDALLTQIKAAKDKELRLRAEKERIRKELEQLRTGELWTREAVKRQDLESIRQRREAVRAAERGEAARVAALDDALKAQELRVRRSKLPTIMNAAASIVGALPSVEPAINGEETESRTRPSTSTQRKEAFTSASAGETSVPKAKRLETEADSRLGMVQVPRTTHSDNQTADAVDNLLANINLDDQQRRIARLQADLARSLSLRDKMMGVDELPHTPVPLVNQPRRPAVLPDNGDEMRSGDSVRGLCDQLHNTPPSETVKEPIASTAVHPPNASGEPKVSNNIGASDTHRSVHETTTPCNYPQYSFHPYYQQHHSQPFQPWPPPPQWQPPWGPPHQPSPWPTQPPSLTGYPPFSPVIAAGIPPYWGCQSSGYNVIPYYTPMMPSSSGTYQQPTLAPPTGLPPLHVPPSVLPRSQFDPRTLPRPLQTQPQSLQVDQDQSEDSKEYDRIHDLLSGLKTEVTKLATVGANEYSNAIDENGNFEADNGLRSIKRQHLEAVMRVQNECDLLEEQEKLDEIKERVSKRRVEREREQQHEEWVAKQKQDLVALKMKRAMVKMEASNVDGGGSSKDDFMRALLQPNCSYSPSHGIVLAWDYAVGVASTATTAQLTYAVYDGRLPRTPAMAVEAKELEENGPKHKRCIFAAMPAVKPLPATAEMRVIIELSSRSQPEPNGKAHARSLGWTVLELFQKRQNGDALVLRTGFFKLPLKSSPMPDPSKALAMVPPSVAECGDIMVHIRVAHGEQKEEMAKFTIDPDTHAGLYQFAIQESTPHQKVTRNRSDSVVGHPTDEELPREMKATAPSITENVTEKVMTPQHEAQRLNTSVTAPPPSGGKRDFLDVERLRLLSSASSTRPNTTRPRSVTTGAKDVSRLYRLDEDNGDEDTSQPWLQVDHSMERKKRVLSVTLSKVTVVALHDDRTRAAADDNNEITQLNQEARNPSYDLCVEYRERLFNPTLTLIVRVDAIDSRTSAPAIVGYAVLPVFLDVETLQQPSRSSAPHVALNDGGFQLPLHTGITITSDTEATTQFTAASAVASFPRIPCSTILIRVKRAIMSEDGLDVLSRKSIPSAEWGKHGLLSPAPPYHSRVYDSTSCTPSATELKLYQILAQNNKAVSVAQSLQRLGANEFDAKMRLEAKPSAALDFHSAFQYQSSIGFRIAVDGLHQVKSKPGVFYKVICSIAPPASLYRATPFTNGVYFITTTDWTSAQTSPEFQDDFLTFRDLPADRGLVAILDIRTVTKKSSKASDPFVSQPYAWSFLPVLTSHGAVSVGNFQLPLFTGEVKMSLINTDTAAMTAMVEAISTEKMKTQLPLADTASIIVRLQDPQVPTSAGSRRMVDTMTTSMIPSKYASRYKYDVSKINAAKKKAPLSKLLPSGVVNTEASGKRFEKELNQAFATELGLSYHAF